MTKRMLKISLPESDQTPTLLELSCYEELSQPYRCKALVLFSQPIALTTLLGQVASLSLQDQRWHGIIDHVTRHSDNTVELTVIPKLALLQYSQRCRAYQQRSVVEIIAEILASHQQQVITTQLSNSYPQLEYRVQYNESDLAFINRLLAEHSIHYYLQQQNDQAQLILMDDLQKLPRYPITLEKMNMTSPQQHSVFTWKNTLSSTGNESYNCHSTYLNLTAGSRIRIAEKEFILNTITHQAKDYSQVATLQNTLIQNYQNTFTCQARLSNKKCPAPIIPSALTARVVSDPQITVQFHWDREGENSSWLALGYAAKQQWSLRKDQEVLVMFRDGDPNYPEIIGGLYNSEHAHPFMENENNPLVAYSSEPSHAIIFNDTKVTSAIKVKSAKDLQQQSKTLNELSSSSYTIHAASQLWQMFNGKNILDAKEIHLQVGTSSIAINAQGIQCRSEQIRFGLESAALRPAARNSDSQQCMHSSGLIQHGSTNVFINGQPAARINDMTTCQQGVAPIVTGNEAMLINNLPAARAQDQTAHGGTIMQGSKDVMM